MVVKLQSCYGMVDFWLIAIQTLWHCGFQIEGCSNCHTHDTYGASSDSEGYYRYKAK